MRSTTRKHLYCPKENHCFGEDNLIDTFSDKFYYQPTARNHPTFDSFILNRSDHRTIALQVMVGKRHNVLPKRLIFLKELGQKLNIWGLMIRIIVVVLEGSAVEIEIEHRLYEQLSGEVYALGVTEGQLFPTRPNT